jgi:hypothetical protein
MKSLATTFDRTNSTTLRVYKFGAISSAWKNRSFSDTALSDRWEFRD